MSNSKLSIILTAIGIIVAILAWLYPDPSSRDTISNANDKFQRETSDVVKENTSVKSQKEDLEKPNKNLLKSKNQIDNIALSTIKGIAIGLISTFAFILSIPAFFVDIFLLFFKKTFPILGWLWSYVWEDLTFNWFWASSETPGRILGISGGMVGIFMGLKVYGNLTKKN